MYEFTCPVCGKVKQVEREHQVRTYCSKSCAQVAVAQRNREINAVCITGECIFQPETVECYKRTCSKCGWNPVVAKARIDAYLKKRQQSEEG